MRIILSGQTYYPGNNGQAAFTIHLAEGLVQSGNDVTVIVPAFENRHSQTEMNGVKIEKIASLSLLVHPEAFITLFPGKRVSQILNAFRPDVIHIQDHYPLNRSIVHQARKNNVPILATNHFLPENVVLYFKFLPLPYQTKIRLLWDNMLSTVNLCDAATTPTETAANILRSQKIKIPVTPISCGVDTNRFRPLEGINRAEVRRSFGLDEKKPLFVYVGRLDAEKRLDIILNALAETKNKDIQFAIIGRGAHGETLKHLTHHLGLENQVKFLGFVSAENLPPLLNSADIFTMPSPEELQSIATLEAMSCKRPILAAKARALPELVAHQVNGYLFSPNQIQDAANGISYLVQHQQDWEKMGQASLEKVQKHAIQNTIKRYEEAYRQIIRKKMR